MKYRCSACGHEASRVMPHDVSEKISRKLRFAARIWIREFDLCVWCAHRFTVLER